MSTFLPRKRTSFYTRLVIPKGLRGYFAGRREVWRSLGTVEREEATYRSLQVKASAHRIFKALTQHGKHMTKDQIEGLISNWLEKALESDEAWRETYGPITDEREPAALFIHDGLAEAQEALASNDYSLVKDEVVSLLQAANLPLPDQASAEYGRLCRRFLRAKVEFAKIQLDRWRGEYRDDHRRKATVLPSSSTSTPISLPFTVVLDKYLMANPRPARTADPLKAEFLRFLKFVGGDKPISNITRADCVSYKEDLQAGRKLTLMTCLKHLSNLETFFKWAGNHDYFPVGLPSPAKGLAPSKKQAKKQIVRRRPFTTEELVTVLGLPEFLGQRKQAPERFWLVLLLVFQGCRREEAAQLYLKDLGMVGDIHMMDITEEEADQTLKNAASRRKVPLHSGLVKVGFLKYVESMRMGGHKRLFPQLNRKGKNGYGDPVGKWFGRLVTSVGLTDPRLVIHSFRRGMVTALHSAGVPVNIAEVITGHSAGTVHAEYVHKDLIAMKTIQKALEKVQFPEVVKLLCAVQSKAA